MVNQLAYLPSPPPHPFMRPSHSVLSWLDAERQSPEVWQRGGRREGLVDTAGEGEGGAS